MRRALLFIERRKVLTESHYIDAVNMYSQTIYSIAFHYFGNRSDAEDVMQECFIKLFRAKRTFSSDEEMKRWLIRVAINECHSLFRVLHRKKTIALDEIESHF